MLKLRHLLGINLAGLEQSGIVELLVRLPRGGADVLGSERVGEHLLDLLEGLARGLGEGEEHVQEHGGVEDAEDDVDLPLDVDERGGHEVAEGEVEDPVRGGGERDGLAADAEGEELGWVNPADGTPCGCVTGHEEVGTGDDGFGWWTRERPGGFGNVADALGAGVRAVGRHQASVRKHESHHAKSAHKQRWPTSPAINVEQRRNGEDDIDDVLDRRGNEQIVASETSHGEDVDNVQHHDVHACQLGPDLGEDSDVGSPDHVGLDEFQEGGICVVAFEFVHVLDFLKLLPHKVAVGIAFTMDKSQDSMALLPSVLTSQPAR